MKCYRTLKYWWWYSITIGKDEDHEDLKAITYYSKGWWQSDSIKMARRLKCKFRLCKKIFKKAI